MKLVKLTAADVDEFKKGLPAAQPATPPVLHREELNVDGLGFGLVRPTGSEDPRTNTYTIAFSRGDSDYVFIVRPTVHETPSMTLNIVQRASGEFVSYTLLKDTVTTLKGHVSGLPKAQIEGSTSEAVLANFDLADLLKHLKVQ